MDEPPVVDESGDLALSSFGTGQHYGSTAAVPRQRFDEVLISAQVASAGAEPIDETPVSAELTMARPMFRSVEVYALSAGQARDLVLMLGSLLPALLEDGPVRRREDVPDGCPSWCIEEHEAVMHARSTGGVELLGQAFDVQVSDSAGWGPAVDLFTHEGDATEVVTFTPAQAVELGLALLAAGALGGAR